MLNFEQGTRGERILRQQATPLSRERSKDQILKAVKSGDLFGMVQVNIGVPEKLRDGFYPKNISCRLFQWNVYSLLYYGSTFRIVWRAHAENIGTLKKPRRLLVDGMKAENIFIATPHLRWYPKHKMKVTQVHEVIEFQSQSCFESFVGEDSNVSRMGIETKTYLLSAEIPNPSETRDIEVFV